jgi:hypothetical protein
MLRVIIRSVVWCRARRLLQMRASAWRRASSVRFVGMPQTACANRWRLDTLEEQPYESCLGRTVIGLAVWMSMQARTSLLGPGDRDRRVDRLSPTSRARILVQHFPDETILDLQSVLVSQARADHGDSTGNIVTSTSLVVYVEVKDSEFWVLRHDGAVEKSTSAPDFSTSNGRQ